MKLRVVIALLSLATTAHAQVFLTPQQLSILDARYGLSTNSIPGTRIIIGSMPPNRIEGFGLTRLTEFGHSAGQVTGYWNALYIDPTLASILLAPYMAGTGVIAGADGRLSVSNATPVTADTTTITNNGSGQFSVKHYDTNAAARTFYLRNVRDSWNDYAESHINATQWGEATSTGVLAVTWAQLTGP